MNDVNCGALTAKAKALNNSPAPDNLDSKSKKFFGKVPLYNIYFCLSVN